MLFLVLSLWPQLQKPEVYCLCRQVFLYGLNYQNWACWPCWNSCLKQVSLLLGTYSQCLLDCAKHCLSCPKPQLKFSVQVLWIPGISYRSSLTLGFDKCLAWLLHTPVLLIALITLRPPSPLLALSPWQASCPILSKHCGCTTALALIFWKCSEVDSSFSNLRLWFLSLNFMTTLRTSSRTATCLAGFPWKGKIVLLASLKHLSAMMVARNPNQYCCLLCYLVSGNILICLVLCLGTTNRPSKPTHCVFVLMCTSSRMLVSDGELSPVCTVTQLAGGEGSYASYSFCGSSQCCFSVD